MLTGEEVRVLKVIERSGGKATRRIVRVLTGYDASLVAFLAEQLRTMGYVTWEPYGPLRRTEKAWTS